MKQFVQNEEAVSPVIGVILMVAITVILAAVIAAFVFGMTGNVSTTKNVALGVKEANNQALQITVQGGQDLQNLQYLKITIGSTAYYTQSTAGSITTDTASSSAGDFTVGSVWTTANTILTSGSDHIVIVGHFNDGSDQMLVDTNL